MSNILNLPYGHDQMVLSLPDQIQVDVVLPPDISAHPHPTQLVETALQYSLKTSLEELTKNKPAGSIKIAIAVNDKTRPVAYDILLPPLLSRLSTLGIQKSNITLLVAMGTHVPMPAEEYEKILPAALVREYTVLSHDCDAPDLVSLGSTQKGTPVFVNRTFSEADIRIVTGNIEPHHFMGFGGGVKSASIGLAGRQTINTNHAMLLDPRSRVGEFERNPMRMDIEEIGEMMGVHFALNVIPNREKGIVHILAGNPRAVMEAGIPLSRAVCQVDVSGLYDLVLASVGGYPKDINLYQSQKALTHASLITRDSGTIILVAECIEGSGSAGFEQFMEGVSTLDQVFDKFRSQGFRIGPHKAFQIAREAARTNILLISELPAEKTEHFFMKPAGNLQDAWDLIKDQLPENARIAVMPRATNTIPHVTH